MIKDNIKKIIDSINEIKIKNSINYPISLMAVTKTFPEECVVDAIKSGITLLGENRVLEAYNKYKSNLIKDLDYQLHIIGHLQRNKVKQAVEISSMIQSIDKIETLDVVEKEANSANKEMDYLIEINTTNEPQKYGISPENLDHFIDIILEKNYNYCNLRGLMTVGPFTEDNTLIRNSFSLLNKLFLNVKNYLNKKDFDIISMGMSNDYKIAIEEGSTLVRVGSAIFGIR